LTYFHAQREERKSGSTIWRVMLGLLAFSSFECVFKYGTALELFEAALQPFEKKSEGRGFKLASFGLETVKTLAWPWTTFRCGSVEIPSTGRAICPLLLDESRWPSITQKKNSDAEQRANWFSFSSRAMRTTIAHLLLYERDGRQTDQSTVMSFLFDSEETYRC
jgi:hypothetical protein